MSAQDLSYDHVSAPLPNMNMQTRLELEDIVNKIWNDCNKDDNDNTEHKNNGLRKLPKKKQQQKKNKKNNNKKRKNNNRKKKKKNKKKENSNMMEHNNKLIKEKGSIPENEQEEEQNKQYFGTLLFEQIKSLQPTKTPKITGMILALGLDVVKKLLQNENELKNKVNEAVQVLEKYNKQ